MEKIKFILNGCDISFYAEAPKDMTIEQLLKQADKIEPNWCACGICSYKRGRTDESTDPEIIFDYNSVKKANDDVSCSIIENLIYCPVCGRLIYNNTDKLCKTCQRLLKEKNEI